MLFKNPIVKLYNDDCKIRWSNCFKIGKNNPNFPKITWFIYTLLFFEIFSADKFEKYRKFIFHPLSISYISFLSIKFDYFPGKIDTSLFKK